MGYRSDVAYTIRFVDDHDTNNEQSFYTFLAEAKSNPKYALALKEVAIIESRQEINFNAEDVKWYESYADVDSHMALVGLAEDWVKQVCEGTLHCRLGVIFMRVGEDTTDTEERANGDYEWSWIQISRQIITDWS